MKKKWLIIGVIVLILLVGIIILVNKTSENKQKEVNVVATTNSFTILDNGTEISVLLKNNSKEDVTVNKIQVDLYDSSNKKIKTINKEEKYEIKANQEKAVELITNEKYPETSEIKYKIYD